MNGNISKQSEAVHPYETIQFSERFRAFFKLFWIVFGSFWIVFPPFFASFRRRRREVLVDVIVDRSIKKSSQKIFKNFLIDRSSTTPKTTSRRRRRQKDAKKMMRKRSKTIRKRFKMAWESLEKIQKIVHLGWAHCFWMLWNFRLNMEFDTLVLHVSVSTEIESSKSRCYQRILGVFADWKNEDPVHSGQQESYVEKVT